jgi:hypothetical protein
MSLAWYVRRLKSMSPGEVLHRVHELALKVSARTLTEGWERYASEGDVPVIPGLRQAVMSASPEVRAAISEAARRHIDGRFSALGRDWPRRLPGVPISPDLWRLDPVTGRLWPGADAFTFDIQYRHERRFGDIKYVWEFNRLQFLQPLAADVALTGNPRAVTLIEDVIASWYEANPPFRGVGWNSGIECALRAISVLVASSLAGDRFSADTVRRVRAMLAAHAFWIARFPSRFSSANNHLVAEAAGTLLLSLAMPDLPNAAAQEAVAREVLVREADLQIHADGTPAEQSPTYGAFTAEFLLLSAFAAKAARSPLPESVTQRLALFAHYIAWLADARGRVPAMGDDDEGRVLSLGTHEACYAVSIARAAAGFVGQPTGLPPVSSQLRDAVFPRPPPAPEMAGLATFADGGLTVVREMRGGRALTLALDHGPLGYLSIAAHGHADALALVAAVDGRPVLVDPGTYLYHSGGAWRDWFRGTSAHNTLSLQGTNQSEIAGAFNWRSKANARLDDVRDGPGWQLRASHDGYEHAFGVRHERTASATEDGFAIRDRLLGTDAPLPVEIAFQLAADCEATLDERTVTVRAANGAPILLHFETPGEIGLARGGELDSTSERPAIQDGGGWVSPAFGIKHPAWRIVWRGRIASTGALVRVQLT